MLLKETLGLRCERGKVKVRIQAPRSTGKCNSSAAGVEAAMDESRSARGMWKTETGGQALRRLWSGRGRPCQRDPARIKVLHPIFGSTRAAVFSSVRAQAKQDCPVGGTPALPLPAHRPS
jgi:hypothetical protein